MQKGQPTLSTGDCWSHHCTTEHRAWHTVGAQQMLIEQIDQTFQQLEVTFVKHQLSPFSREAWQAIKPLPFQK